MELQNLAALDQLGALLKARRLELNLQQEEVARALRLSRATLSKLESGAATDTGLSILLRLLRHYGLKLLVAPGGKTPTLAELDLRRELERQAAQGSTEPSAASRVVKTPRMRVRKPRRST